MIKYVVKNETMIKQGFSGYESDYFDTLAEQYQLEQIRIDTQLGIWNVYSIEEVEVND